MLDLRMSRRGRRRNSKRRKSSSSNKQSVSPYIFKKQNKNNNCNNEDLVEKGETDSFRKENVLSASEDEEKYNNSAPKEKRVKEDYHLNSFVHQKSIYNKTTKDEEKGVKIVTSVSVTGDSSPKIKFEQSQEPLSGNPTHSPVPVTNILNINCTGSHVKLQLNTSGTKTTFVFMNRTWCSTEVLFKNKCEGTWMPDDESSEQLLHNVREDKENQNSNDRTHPGTINKQTEAPCDSKYARSENIWDSPDYCQCCSDHKQQISADFKVANHLSSPPLLLNIKPQEKRQCFHKSLSGDQFWDIPPPQEFADIKHNSLEGLTEDLASCKINTSSQADVHSTSTGELRCLFSPQEEERSLPPSFDQLSESGNYDPMFMRPFLFTSRSNLTMDFINGQKKKPWIRNNSITTVEHRACSLPKKRRQTFPGTSQSLRLIQEDLQLPYRESFSSLIMCSFPVQTERLERTEKGDGRLSPFGIENNIFSQTKGGLKLFSETEDSHDRAQPFLSPFCVTGSENNPDEMFTNTEHCQRHDCSRQHDANLSICKDMEGLDTDDCEYTKGADSGFDQEFGEGEYHSPLTEELSRRALSIQIIPPSCSGSEEHMLQNHPEIQFPNNEVKNENQKDSVSFLPEYSKSSVHTITGGALEQSLLQRDTLSPDSCLENHLWNAVDDLCTSLLQDLDVQSLNSDEVPEDIKPKPTDEKMESTSPPLPLMSEDTNDLQLNTGRIATETSNQPTIIASCLPKGSTDIEVFAKEALSKTKRAEKQIVSRSSLEIKEHLKPVVHKDPDISASEHWAKRRKLFKESKQKSSAGGSSITSDITEESVSEDTHSMDTTFQEAEERGFYTETFHSSAWIFQGDDIGPGAIHPSLTTRTRAVSIRERTVKISKGAGEYPWGFRIQFSKPIVVTEVDTNGAAEEAGLMVGDYVLAVNGIDVTSIPHSEAADLARQGPDVLTLTIGSDIARGPNTPRPACRGYLHKRTQSGLIKGWRKRWFVLTHDCCLYYYRHKRDEGKRRALSAVKMEGAEVGPDTSLGKPFVFKCQPQSGIRVYFFCATSNQEMKRWLEAMEKATHPITQNHVWVDVTKHNSNLPPLAVKNPDCLGLLHKMDQNKDSWVQHYCILKDGCLYLYSGIRATHAQGGIYLQGYVVREQPHGSKNSIIELKPPSDEFRTFYLCAENPNENQRWIIAIKASVKKWLPLHRALHDYMNGPPEETRM